MTFTGCGAVLEAELLAGSQMRDVQGGASLLRELNDSLHELSQPITVLLCTLECGAGMDSIDEIKQMLFLAQEASGRLRETAIKMQSRLRIALEEK